MEWNKLEYKLYNKSVVVCTNEWKQPKCHCDMLLLFPWTNIRHGWLQPILGRTWLEWIRLSRIFRAPFANLSLEIVKTKWVDTISYLVFRGSSANLSPTCTFLERYLSRRHFKSMPVDLDYIKPFMGFCTTLIYNHVPIQLMAQKSCTTWDINFRGGTFSLEQAFQCIFLCPQFFCTLQASFHGVWARGGSR